MAALIPSEDGYLPTTLPSRLSLPLLPLTGRSGGEEIAAIPLKPFLLPMGESLSLFERKKVFTRSTDFAASRCLL